MFSAKISRSMLKKTVGALDGLNLPRLRGGVEAVLESLEAVFAQSNEQAFLLAPPQALYNSCLICLEIIDGLNEAERSICRPK